MFRDICITTELRCGWVDNLKYVFELIWFFLICVKLTGQEFK